MCCHTTTKTSVVDVINVLQQIYSAYTVYLILLNFIMTVCSVNPSSLYLNIKLDNYIVKNLFQLYTSTSQYRLLKPSQINVVHLHKIYPLIPALGWRRGKQDGIIY